MSDQENEALITKMYEAFTNPDMLRNEVFAPDVVWHIPGRHPLSGTIRGIDEVLNFFAQLMKSGLQVSDLEIHAIPGDRVADHHRLVGGKDGVSLDVRVGSLYQIRNGRIAEISDYLDKQHEADHYYSQVYKLKPIPARLATATSPAENKRIVQKFLENFSTGNVNGVLGAMANGAAWRIMGNFPLAGVRTKQEFGESMQSMRSLIPDGVKIRVRSLVAEGSRVAVEADAYGAVNNGKIYKSPLHLLIEVEDGEIQAVREYMDTYHLNEIFNG